MRRPLATATGKRNGQPGRRLPVFVCPAAAWLAAIAPQLHGMLVLGSILLLTAGLAFAAPPALDTSSLNELTQLARAGAPQLALRRMDAEQPKPDQDLVAWSAWEQERLQILINQKLYAALIERVSALPPAFDPGLRRFALTLKADAQLQLNQADAARATLRDLLWSTPEAPRVEWAQWRQLVIRSYVLEDRSEDARLSLLRYRQDFGDEEAQMRWLNGQVMLQSGHADAAYDLLKDDNSPQGSFLRYSAQLKVMPQQAAKVAEAAVSLAKQSDRPMLQGAIWGLAAQAAGEAGQPLKRIQYLEQALSLPIDEQLNQGVISYNANQLWDAYIAAGKRIGNDEQKLLGSDEDWYFPATEAVGKDPLRARILFSVLAEYGSSPERRAVAHEYLVGLLDDLPNGKQLTRRLYLESARYADAGSLPSVIRYRLIDEALESGDLDTASRLMADLAEPPTGSDRFEWDLRRARVAIYTGDSDAGVGLLQQLLKSDEQEWNEQRVDRLLQVVFDLQTVKQHDQALVVFTGLLDKPLAVQQRRELLFWMADSLQGLEHYDEAAYLYLKSATLVDPTAMDPWAQTARYRAAKSLVDAGLVEDARQIYGLLLRATKDASRKAVLQNELQRLHLVSSTRQEGKGR
jgi:hypothetical protein